MVAVPLATVLAQLGAERIAGAVPEVEVVEVPMSGPAPEGLRAEILFAVPVWSPTLEDLLGRGVTWLQVAGTGVDALPPAALRGRVVTCARGASAVPIAEFALAAMLCRAKQLPESWLSAPSDRHGYAELASLDGQTLGLVGLGGIGSALARRAVAMGMRVLAVRRTAAPGPPGVEVCGSLDEVLAVSDHLVLAAPATARTRRLLDAEAFKKCKAGLHLVNVARGSLVDHDALLEALDAGVLSRATLDVTDPEPLPAGHPLLSHPRVLVSAHVSWSAPGALDRLVDEFVGNLRRHLAGDPLAGVVDPEEGY
ncbi:MAG: NAD(P)-dependent oxidoreductase [Acidimicrobiales bacterium]